jgi:hypothetical protein
VIVRGFEMRVLRFKLALASKENGRDNAPSIPDTPTTLRAEATMTSARFYITLEAEV